MIEVTQPEIDAWLGIGRVDMTDEQYQRFCDAARLDPDGDWQALYDQIVGNTPEQ